VEDQEKVLENLREQYESTPHDTSLDGIGTLTRYFLWADKMLHDFDALIKNNNNINEDIFLEHGHIYMSYWYGALYVVIEGWHDLKLHDEEIDELISSPNINLLKRYRNGVFHFQKKFIDARFMDLMLAGTESVFWVRGLHKAFRRFFINWMKIETQRQKNSSNLNKKGVD
jgi:hypothetical protein